MSKLEKKLVSMEALTPSEDALYSQAVELSGKIEWLASEIQEAIDSGKVIMCRFSHHSLFFAQGLWLLACVGI